MMVEAYIAHGKAVIANFKTYKRHSVFRLIVIRKLYIMQNGPKEKNCSKLNFLSKFPKCVPADNWYVDAPSKSFNANTTVKPWFTEHHWGMDKTFT